MAIRSFISVFLLALITISCSNKSGESSHPESETVEDAVVAVTDEMLDTETDEAVIEPRNPEHPFDLEAEEYRTIQRGKYQPKSIDKKYVSSQYNIIEPFRLKDISFIESTKCMYLANDEPVALFKNRNPKKQSDVAGILQSSTLVDVDTVFYNAVYIDSDKAPMSFEEWYSHIEEDSSVFLKKPLTYDVWYAVNINGKKYYTDYKLHNYIEYKDHIAQKEQVLLICSQGTGYDGGYDRGYPDFYEVVVLGKSDKANGWKHTYRSQRLDLNNGGADEYGLNDYFMENKPSLDSDGNYVINLGELCKLIWTGERLIVQQQSDENNTN